MILVFNIIYVVAYVGLDFWMNLFGAYKAVNGVLMCCLFWVVMFMVFLVS